MYQKNVQKIRRQYSFTKQMYVNGLSEMTDY